LLRHESFNQTHDQWYYKMYFTMLKQIFRSDSAYYVYLDVKDTHSSENIKKLEDVCANNALDFDHRVIRRIQPIRSDEVQIMQLVDILTGALAFRHNHAVIAEGTSKAKIMVTNRIIRRSGHDLTRTTLASEDKFNLLVWSAKRGEES
jgi:hypothetical protein